MPQPFLEVTLDIPVDPDHPLLLSVVEAGGDGLEVLDAAAGQVEHVLESGAVVGRFFATLNVDRRSVCGHVLGRCSSDAAAPGSDPAGTGNVDTR